jgi:hypothetical protein
MKSDIIAKKTPIASLSLQLVIEFERYFQIFWAVVTFVFLYYKKYQLIYPDGYFELE